MNEVMTKTPSQIEKETGRKLIDIYNEYVEQGYSLTEISMKLELANIKSLSSYLRNYDLKQQLSNKNKEDLLFNGELVGIRLPEIKKMFIDKLNIEYEDWLRQKYVNEGMSPFQISLITGIKLTTLSKQCELFGFRKTQKQAHEDAVKQGIYDPSKNLKKARDTMYKKVHSGKGSNAQQLFATLLKNHLGRLTNSLENIEVIVGYNEYNILNNYEIDIPIIIFYNDEVYKIAIEYDGDKWHNDNQYDTYKEAILNGKDWKLVRIEANNQTAVNMRLVEHNAQELANKIISYIK